MNRRETTNITIDGTSIAVPEEVTLLEAARLAGVTIPTLCHLDSLEPDAACMICVVEDRATGRLVPACSSPAKAYREIATDNEHVRRARKAALELLVSEHLGDCEAPCRRACPVDHAAAQQDDTRCLCHRSTCPCIVPCKD